MKSYRRKRRPVPVSFFAFQDIITALAGCMLIFVLALAAAKSRAGNDSSGGMIDRSEYDLLQNKFKLNSSLLRAEEKKIAALRLKLDREKHNLQSVERRKQLQDSSRKLEKIAEEREKLLNSIQQKLAQQQKKNHALAGEKKVLASLIQQATELEEQYNAQHRKLLFADNSRKQNIILTVSRNTWHLQTRSGQVPELLGNSVTSPEKLLKKLRSFNPGSIRLVIAVRPSAGGFIEQLKNKLQQNFPQLETVAEPLSHETSGGVEL
ncbi:MAG: hypothetical protein E7039_02810 [Lentisphaerae bacterium]|nr:hypothetical protein [Lentisphaerota bacterium]